MRLLREIFFYFLFQVIYTFVFLKYKKIKKIEVSECNDDHKFEFCIIGMAKAQSRYSEVNYPKHGLKY